MTMLTRFVLFFALALSSYIALPKKPAHQSYAITQTQPTKITDTSIWHFTAVSDFVTRMVHAPSMVELQNGDIRAFWFAGSREGAPDVSIHTAVFQHDKGRWTEEKFAFDAAWLSREYGQYIRKVGNVVAARNNDGSLRLFVVAVSFGGWASSRLLVLNSTDNGETWQFHKELKTSPFLNISSLVKTPVISYQHDAIALPVYHEFIGKFGEMIHLDKNSDITDMDRIGYGRSVLQPLVLVRSESSLISFLRPAKKGYTYQSISTDGGHQWSIPEKTTMENPGSAVSGIALDANHWLIAGNCNKLERDDLCIKESTDAGKSWHIRWELENQTQWRNKSLTESDVVQQLPDGLLADDEVDNARLLLSIKKKVCDNAQNCELKFDYPYMLQAANGDIHVLYTWNKILIRHAWLCFHTQEQSHVH